MKKLLKQLPSLASDTVTVASFFSIDYYLIFIQVFWYLSSWDILFLDKVVYNSLGWGESPENLQSWCHFIREKFSSLSASGFWSCNLPMHPFSYSFQNQYLSVFLQVLCFMTVDICRENDFYFFSIFLIVLLQYLQRDATSVLLKKRVFYLISFSFEMKMTMTMIFIHLSPLYFATRKSLQLNWKKASQMRKKTNSLHD